MREPDFSPLIADISEISPIRARGSVCAIESGTVALGGLARRCRVGDLVTVTTAARRRIGGEIVALRGDAAVMLPFDHPEGVALGDAAECRPQAPLRPSLHWRGRMLDAFGRPMDGRPVLNGTRPAELRCAPPPAVGRKRLGGRLETGLAVFNTMLPIARGQRTGLFAGSGVGKSSLLGSLARGVEADVIVFALIGERGRELVEFVTSTLGEAALRRSVVLAATSDLSPLIRRRAAWTAMSVAETFRDAGHHVLLLADSVTRFAEAHREVALAAGEPPSLRAFPPSTGHMIAALTERAGPGPGGSGDITAVFSVLVAGSDMDDPVADILRGVLDGHVVLDREIAERGRFPAIDVRRSVSRSLPRAATAGENALLARARGILGTYHRVEPMVQTGLYVSGADAAADDAVARWPHLDAFFSRENISVADSFAALAEAVGQAGDAPAPDVSAGSAEPLAAADTPAAGGAAAAGGEPAHRARAGDGQPAPAGDGGTPGPDGGAA
ncbi:MAG: FliI/YscN family ATPase [Paracoccaceae bacterium]